MTVMKNTKMTTASTVSMAVLIGLTTWAMPAQAEEATDYRAPAMIDNSAPIAALSTLTSINNAKPLKVTVPSIVHFNTKSGVPVSFVRAAALPIVDIDLRFNAGSARDGSLRADGFGIASMTATMLTQGSKKLAENDFTRAVETLGIDLSSSAYKDMFTISCAVSLMMNIYCQLLI